MKTTKTQKFMLFTLGKLYEIANQKIKGKPLEIFISKKSFIEIVIKAGITKKQERALYKNLEILEKKKLIRYKNKKLMLTTKGKKLFNQIKKQFDPYINLCEKLKEKGPASYTKKIQTVLK